MSGGASIHHFERQICRKDLSVLMFTYIAYCCSFRWEHSLQQNDESRVPDGRDTHRETDCSLPTKQVQAVADVSCPHSSTRKGP